MVNPASQAMLSIICPFCGEANVLSTAGGQCGRCGGFISWEGPLPGSISLAAPATVGSLLTVQDLASVGLLLDGAEQHTTLSRGGDASIVMSGPGKNAAQVTLDFVEEKLRPEDIVSNFTEEVAAEDHAVVVSGADEAYLSLDHEDFGVMEAALVARREAFIFRLTIPSSARSAEQLARLAGIILLRYAGAPPGPVPGGARLTCRYCNRAFVAQAGCLDCPFCGAANSPPVPMPTTIAAAGSIHLGVVNQMAQSLTYNDFLSVGLSPKSKEPQVYDDPDARTVACVFETYAWDGSTKIGFAILNDAIDTKNRIEEVMRHVPGPLRPTTLAGAEEAYIGHAKKSAALCARRAHLVFRITVPESPQAEAQLATLGGIVLGRVTA